MTEVVSCSIEGEIEGAVRTCAADLTGSAGAMVERCVEFTPMSRIAFLVDDESLGIRRRFDNYGFALNLAPLANDRTRVTLQTHYTPRNPFYSMMNALAMRRRFGAVCDGIVAGLTSFAEARNSEH